MLRLHARASTPAAPSPGRCASPARSSTRRSRRCPLELVAGLQVAIANVAAGGRGGRRRTTARSTLPQGQRIALREVPVALGRRVRARRARALPEHRRDGRRHAPAPPAWSTSPCARRPGPTGEIDPVDPRHLPAVRRGARLPHGRRPGDRRARLRHRDASTRVDVIVGPGNLYVQEAKHQLSAIVGIDGFAGPSDLLVVLGARRRRARARARGARHARAGRARRGQPRRRRLALRGASATRSPASSSGSSSSAHRRRAAFALVAGRRAPARRSRSPTPSRPSTCS